MTTTPGRLLKAIGLPDDANSRAWVIGVGIREYAGAVNLLVARHYRAGTIARVAGDTMDLALLASAWGKRKDGDRLKIAMGTVATFLLIDSLAALKAVRESSGDTPSTPEHRAEDVDETPQEPRSPVRVKTSVTVRMGEDELRTHWRKYDWSEFDPQELEDSGDVRFVKAPGERGTEIHLDHTPDANRFAATLGKFTGTAPDQKIHDDLRRFKALVETGVIPVSDSAPEGASSKRQIKQQPAQPPAADRVGGKS